MLSITSRLAGVFMTVLTLPVMFLYLLSIAAGPETYQQMTALLGSLPGKLFCLVNLLLMCWHFSNSMRHLIWDTGNMLSMEAIYKSGYIAVVCAAVLFALVLWRVMA
jgi:succinate dehydrogenase cytochrome b556 subunit